MQEAIVHAAKACGGLATDAEMAAFLREIMPEETQAIAHRLDRYRKEITQPHGLMASYDQSVSHELPTELFHKGADLIPPPPTSGPYLSTSVQGKTEETLVSQKSVSRHQQPFIRSLLIGGALAVAASILFVMLSRQTEKRISEVPKFIKSEPIEDAKTERKPINAAAPVPPQTPEVKDKIAPPTVEEVKPNPSVQTSASPQSQTAQSQTAQSQTAQSQTAQSATTTPAPTPPEPQSQTPVSQPQTQATSSDNTPTPQATPVEENSTRARDC